MIFNRLLLIIPILLCATLAAEPRSSYTTSYYRYVNTLPPKVPDQPQSQQEDSDQERCVQQADFCDCILEPKDSCVEVGCYSPSFYNLVCDSGVFANLEFLYWYAKETNLSYAIELTEQPDAPGSTTFLFGIREVEYLGTSWDPGVRAGIGMNSCMGDLDLGISWTWIKNTRSDKTNVPPFSSNIQDEVGDPFLISPWINQSFHRGTFALWNLITAKWELSYNQFDLTLGRKYWTGPCFALRPFVAIRGAFWETKFTTKSFRGIVGAADGVFGTDRFKNTVWGVGFLGGLDTTWYFCRNFALYGQFDVALLWGEFKNKKSERIFSSSAQGVIGTDYSNQFKGKCSLMTPEIDAGIGVRWECTWCNCSFRSTLDIGWEHHTLFDQNHRIKTIENFLDSNSTSSISGFRSYVESNGNISFGGLVVRGRIDF